MAVKKSTLTKTALMNEIETKIQALNLLKSALQGDRSRKPETLQSYQDQFHEVLTVRGKK